MRAQPYPMRKLAALDIETIKSELNYRVQTTYKSNNATKPNATNGRPIGNAGAGLRILPWDLFMNDATNRADRARNQEQSVSRTSKNSLQNSRLQHDSGATNKNNNSGRKVETKPSLAPNVEKAFHPTKDRGRPSIHGQPSAARPIRLPLSEIRPRNHHHPVKVRIVESKLPMEEEYDPVNNWRIDSRKKGRDMLKNRSRQTENSTLIDINRQKLAVIESNNKPNSLAKPIKEFGADKHASTQPTKNANSDRAAGKSCSKESVGSRSTTVAKPSPRQESCITDVFTIKEKHGIFAVYVEYCDGQLWWFPYVYLKSLTHLAPKLKTKLSKLYKKKVEELKKQGEQKQQQQQPKLGQ